MGISQKDRKAEHFTETRTPTPVPQDGFHVSSFALAIPHPGWRPQIRQGWVPGSRSRIGDRSPPSMFSTCHSTSPQCVSAPDFARNPRTWHHRSTSHHCLSETPGASFVSQKPVMSPPKTRGRSADIGFVAKPTRLNPRVLSSQKEVVSELRTDQKSLRPRE